MTDYTSIEQLRSKKEFLRVEITAHSENGEEVQGVDPKINSAYLVKGAVVLGMGLAAPVLENVGISSLAILSAQTLLIGMVVGQLSKRAQANSQLNQLESAYIYEHGTQDEKDQLSDTIEHSKNHRSLKRGLLVASTVLVGSMTVMEMANNGASTFLSNSLSVAGGLSIVGAGVMHLYDKLASTDRGRLAHAIAKRRNETQTPAPGSPQAKTQL